MQQTHIFTQNNFARRKIMNCDMLLGVVIGGLIGATVVALNKPAQNTIRKTAETLKEEAQNIIEKAKR